MVDVLILGAGLSGISAAVHLKREYTLFERKPEIGGLCRSRKIDGFVFDYGPHILFPKDEYVASLIKEVLGSNLHIQDREAWIYHHMHHTYTKFPFQSHLYGLPRKIVRECIVDLFNAMLKESDQTALKNYKDWIYWNFGKGIAEYLMIPYARKLWTVDPEKMNYEWVWDRVPRPSIEQVVDGAIGDSKNLIGFNNVFWYPIDDGISALPNAFLPMLKNIQTSKEATQIDLKKKFVEFDDGEKVYYNELISTVPLPELVKLAKDVPEEIRTCASELQHNSVMCVNLGVERENISDKHWLYFYEDCFSFHRISFPMNFSPNTVPAGHSSISVEISYSKHESIDNKNIIEKTRDELITSNVLLPDDELVVADVMVIKYAYIIYDYSRSINVSRLHSFFNSNSIFPCGRFGEWEYYNMDHSIASGIRSAIIVNKTQAKLRRGGATEGC